MSTMTGNPTYNLTAMSKDEILQKKNGKKKVQGVPPFGAANIRNFPPRGRYWPSQIVLDSLTSQESVQAEIYCEFGWVLNQASFSDSNKDPNRS